MHHSILKKHQIHSSNEIIVARHSFSQQFAQLLPGFNRHVFWLTDTTGEVAIYVWFLEYYAFVYVLVNNINLNN